MGKKDAKQSTKNAHSLVGQAVPNIRLAASDGSNRSLTDFHGEMLVVYFYPKDHTPGCTKEACSFRDQYHEFESAGARVIGVSADKIDSHQRFIAKHDLPFLLLSDPNKKLADAFGVKRWIGMKRATFLVDTEGTIIREWQTVRISSHAQDVLDALAEIEANRGSVN